MLSAEIIPSRDIHMYNDNSLCLFYPGDHKWNNSSTLAENIVLWVIEWIYYYEIWKLTGTWEGKEVMH